MPRFIPAHAGNMGSRLILFPTTTVHPRTRGEHISTTAIVRLPTGSSPHTRGTYVVDCFIKGVSRFIPAHAGNIRSARVNHGISAGSSPHTRGTCFASVHGPGEIRFIPAHAGNISWQPPDRRRVSVHPRTRGEHIAHPWSTTDNTGSSPHTRGTFLQLLLTDERIRFIPAHAGNMSEATAFAAAIDGSSPHTRGTSTHSHKA